MNNYTPPSMQPSLESEYRGEGARSVIRQEIAQRNTYRLLNDVPAHLQGKVIHWQLTLNDFSDGMGAFQGPFNLLSNNYAWASGVDLSHANYMLLAQIVTSQASTDPSPTFMGIHSTQIFGRHFIGIGDDGSTYIFVETSTANPALANFYSATTPTGSVTFLGSIQIGGTAGVRNLMIGFSGGDAESINDVPDSIVAHGDTSNLRWAVQTGLNNASDDGYNIVFQDATTVYLQSTSEAAIIITNPTFTNTHTNSYLIHKEEFALERGDFGGLKRIWFVQPERGGKLLEFGAEGLGQVYSINLEGTDTSPLLFNEMPAGILQAARVNSPTHGSCIVATDGYRVILHDGLTEENLRIFHDARAAQIISGDVNAFFTCRGFAIGSAGELHAIVQEIDPDAANATNIYIWKYNWYSGKWHVISEALDLDATASLRVVLAAGSHGVSPYTGFLHFYDGSASWHRIHLLRPGEVPYPRSNPSSGATLNFATAGTFYTPRWTLPGSEGLHSMIESVGMTGDIDNSGSGASVTLKFGRQTGFGALTLGGGSIGDVVFNDSTQYEDEIAGGRFRNFRRLPENEDTFDQFYMSATLTRGATATNSPMISSIQVRGFTFLDGRTRTPREIWGNKARNE